MQECLELAEQKLQQMLLEVEAELAQRVAVLSKVLLLVPEGRAWGGPVPVLLSPGRIADTGPAAHLRWERSLSVRQSPLPCHPALVSLQFCPVLCVSPGASAPSHCCSEFSEQLKA